ncbi:hypothetical protein JG687_00002397 [Phytophthora cactorum]|uniref:Uncharacterized protein n=1 Tax=Phytophthora cactorum TaxID=29920 RepID=A0A8T1UV91_9STRA|nr:hypothetical protein JG687_00002397 [Phytophthora cactorum]
MSCTTLVDSQSAFALIPVCTNGRRWLRLLLSSAGSVPEAHEVVPTLSQASQLSDSDVCLFPLGQSTQPMSPSLSAASVVDLTAASTASGDSSGLSTSSLSSSVSLGVAAFGVPLEVCHFRQQNSRHDVWDIAHRLAIPSTKTTDQDAKPFTHVCLLCAQQLTCNPYAEPDAWEGALHRWGNTPNARSHMMALPEDHLLEKAEASMKSKAAARHVGEVMERANSREQKRTIPVTTSDQIGIYIAHWLISAGLPYNTVVTEDFKVLVQRLTGDPDVSIITAATFRDLLSAVYTEFCEMTRELLLKELKAAHGFPFLNLHHDGWSTGNGKVSVLGMSASFIDETWEYREIALLLTVVPSSHAATDVQKMICARMTDGFGIDISAMIQFTVSDTTSSAKTTSKLFEDSIPTDCTMHVLNLCLQYAMGLRENKGTVEVYDPVTNTRKREQRYCTVGGVFQEGRDLIRRVRALNNYFSTQQRCKRLEEIQMFFCLPIMDATLDCDTRDHCELRGIRYYFQKQEKGEGASVFECLSLAGWRLVTEMEAIVCSIADLARVEVQRKELVSSKLIVLLKFASDRLNSSKFSVYDLDAPRTPTTTVGSIQRDAVAAEDLGPLARTCLARMIGQVEQRIATATPATVLILLLDPSTKFSVAWQLHRLPPHCQRTE